MTGEYDYALTDDEQLRISAVVHQNYYMPDVFALVETFLRERRNADVWKSFDRALLRRLQAVEVALDLADAEARHVVDDEVYVSVGLIRNALRTSATPAVVSEPAGQTPVSEDLTDGHQFWINMRDRGCDCGLRFRGGTVEDARRAHAEHVAEAKS